MVDMLRFSAALESDNWRPRLLSAVTLTLTPHNRFSFVPNMFQWLEQIEASQASARDIHCNLPALGHGFIHDPDAKPKNYHIAERERHTILKISKYPKRQQNSIPILSTILLSHPAHDYLSSPGICRLAHIQGKWGQPQELDHLFKRKVLARHFKKAVYGEYNWSCLAGFL